MKKEKQLLDKLAELMAGPIQVFPALVKIINDDYTIDVVDGNDIEYFNVRLKASHDDDDNGLVVEPAVDSSVLVGLIGNTNNALYMVKPSVINRIWVKTTTGITIDGGDNGPVFISQHLIDDLNQVKQDLNDLKSAISGWIPVANDGGAALKTALTNWFGQTLPDTNINDVTNSKLKH